MDTNLKFQTSIILMTIRKKYGLPWWLRQLEICQHCGRPGSIPGSGRSPGEGNGNPLQYSRPENSMGRGTWRAIVHGVARSQTRLSN